MNKLFFLSMAITLFANSYGNGKIDMHGGNDSYGFSKKSGFKKDIACMSDFLDRNTTKVKTSKGK